ncbi:DNA polymerase Y family protein [Sphingomonas sp. R-74633]|uniref:Y-family DNA polymerase n=1 Tax=Sphingomonas sp. R-74633 TaxID=2751188 RepID=UPI0015D31258|nr:DNA polymerase Y family protein [Sphingomonas sp. R-74633]NYT41388.1 DNA polymerase Y family protein [Sphingomonas sp. R-74633]
MQRVAALFLPLWPIERLWRAEARPGARPDPRAPSFAQASLDPLFEAAAKEQEHACSVPRGGGWRPGARWAREDELGKVALPPVTRPKAKHEVGRRDEAAAANPFRPLRPDDGGAPAKFLPQLARGGGPRLQGVVEGPTQRASTRHALPPSLRDGPPPRDKLGEELPPLITSIRNGSRIEIAAACPAAQALGLRSGMAVTQARAQVPGLDIRPADPEGDRASLKSLAMLAARRWSPTVAVSGEDGLLLDLSGTAHLFGGEAAMARRIVRLLARAGFTARIAIADTPGAAWALARFHGNYLCPPGDQARALAELPTPALRIDEAAVELLKRLGVDRIGQLSALPRAPLVRRFGAGVVLRLDQALGHIAEPLDPVIPPEAIAVQQRFAEPIATAEAIEHWLGTLVPRLAAALEAEGLGVQALECIAERIDGVPQRIRIGLARPNRDPAHLLRLLKRRIEDVEPGYGIDAITLHVRRAGVLGPEPMVERLDEEAGPDIATLVDTLATRIGQRRMWRMRPVESDVPERAATRMPVLDPPVRAAQAGKRDDIRQLDRNPPLPPWHPGWPKPARLLARPERLDHVMAELPDHAPRRFTWRGLAHRVVHADGPERIQGEWWKRGAERLSVRDYFRVEDEAGRRYWLFRAGDGERAMTGDLSWYLHGVFG